METENKDCINIQRGHQAVSKRSPGCVCMTCIVTSWNDFIYYITCLDIFLRRFNLKITRGSAVQCEKMLQTNKWSFHNDNINVAGNVQRNIATAFSHSLSFSCAQWWSEDVSFKRITHTHIRGFGFRLILKIASKHLLAGWGAPLQQTQHLQPNEFKYIKANNKIKLL